MGKFDFGFQKFHHQFRQVVGATLLVALTASCGKGQKVAIPIILPEKKAIGFTGASPLLPTDVSFAPLEDYAFNGPHQTDAVLIATPDKVVYEQYSRGHKKDSPHINWSVSKSVFNLLVGASVKEGIVKLEDSICMYLDYVKADANPNKCKITIEHLLKFSSGLDWFEGYDVNDIEKSQVLGMLYGPKNFDMGKYAVSFNLIHEPGARWNYSTGDTTLLAQVIKGAYKKAGKNYDELPWKVLFNPLNVKSAIWEQDSSGSFVGGAYLYTTAMDLAKIGRFVLKDYKAPSDDPSRVLPKDWWTFTLTTAESISHPASKPDVGDNGGASWWINKPIPEKGVSKMFKDAPDDVFFAQGHWGQMLIIVPSKDLVVVRYGNDVDKKMDKNKFLKLALDAVEKFNKK